MTDKPSWQAKTTEFISKFNSIQSSHPDWSREQIAQSLNISERTIRRMFTVYKYMNDPKVSKSLTLNQAYEKIRTLYKDQTSKELNEVTNISNSIFPNGNKTP